MHSETEGQANTQCQISMPYPFKEVGAEKQNHDCQQHTGAGECVASAGVRSAGSQQWRPLGRGFIV